MMDKLLMQNLQHLTAFNLKNVFWTCDNFVDMGI